MSPQPLHISINARRRFYAPLVALTIALPVAAHAQDRLKTMPGYEQYQRMANQIPGSVKPGAVTVKWAADSRSFDYSLDGARLRFDLATRKAAPTTNEAATVNGRGGRGFGGGPARGRQVTSALSPDSTHKAFYRDRNLYVSDTSGRNEFAITTDGSEAQRIKYGTASWVYGEELEQITAMWWNPAGTKIAYYRFDESPVKDYFVGMDQTKVQSAVDVEAYPKAGAPNPVVDVFVYDVATKHTVKLDVRDGKPSANDVVGYYVYHVAWSPDGQSLTFNRTNRRQNALDFTACDPNSGSCRVVVHEEWPNSWTENNPSIQYLADGQRFIWASERTGFRNFYLYDMTGKLLATLTNHSFEVANVVKVDEVAKTMWYMARDGDNHMKMQLHRVSLDGKLDRRLTDVTLHHSPQISPDGKWFVDVTQTHDQPPRTTLVEVSTGKLVAELAKSDMTKFDALKLQRTELYTYKAGDGVTDLHGLLFKPSNFDASKKYPVLVTVYAGPATNGARETFTLPSALTEYGFIVLSLDSRSAAGRGKKFLDAIYQKLGTVEIDDQAAGVTALKSRPYVDLQRVGIFGTSYGGYASAMAILRYPAVFQAASASSAVTDWRNYDTIYTERYMWIPQENAGYDAGSAAKFADKLTGRLMLYFGTADNNVHPSNTMQLVTALQKAGKSFELQVGPDQGHTGLNQARMMEFFIENLVLKPTPNRAAM